MVRRVLNIVYREIRGLHQAAYVLALFAFGSQILALVRDRLLAHNFGADTTLDIYYAAFKLPDLFYVLFASTLSVYVLIPFVSRATKEGDTTAGRELLSQVFSVFLVTYTGVAAVMFFATPYVVPALFPGIQDTESLVSVTRILLLQPFFLGLSSLFGVVTQLGHRFVLYAVSPLIYNLGIILGIVAFYPFFGIAGLAWGVVLGAVGHMLIQVPLVQRGAYAFRLRLHIDGATVREILFVSIPRAFTLSVNQIVLLVIAGIASTMTAGSVAVFQFAHNLHSVPLAIIGASYSVAAFPALADLFARQQVAKFRLYITTAVRHIIFWSIPAIILIIVLRAQLVRVVLGTGAFDWGDTRLTAAVLAVLIVALLSHGINLLLIRTFYAAGHTYTPLTIASIGALIATATAAFLARLATTNPAFVGELAAFFRLRDVAGAEVLLLAVAYTVAVIVQSLLLFGIAWYRFSLHTGSVFRSFVHAVTAGTAAGISAYAALNFFVTGINPATFLGIFLQGLIGGLFGLAGAFIVYMLMGNSELREIHASIRRRLFKTDVVGPEPSVLS